MIILVIAYIFLVGEVIGLLARPLLLGKERKSGKYDAAWLYANTIIGIGWMLILLRVIGKL